MKIVAAIKKEDSYVWYQYSAPRRLTLAAPRGTLILMKGDIFGIRSSSDGKKRRLVERGQLTKVYTISEELYTKLLKASTKKRFKVETPKEEDVGYYDDFNDAASAFIRRVARGVYGYDLGLYSAWTQQIKKLEAGQKKNNQKAAEAATLWFKKPIWTKNKLGPASDRKMVRLASEQLRNLSTRFMFHFVDDPTMFDFSTSDACDHYLIACYLYAGIKGKKMKKATQLSTASRELITQNVWDWIEENV